MGRDREERRKDTHRAGVRARGLYAARLAWVEGFPVETADGWSFQAVPRQGPVERHPLDAERLERAVRAARSIARDLRAPGVDTAPEELLPGWSRLEAVLARLGDLRRGRGPREPSALLADPSGLLGRRAALLGQRLLRDRALSPLVVAAAWAFALTGDELEALEWIAAQAEALRPLVSVLPDGEAARVAVALARLAAGGEPRAAAGVIPLLSDPLLVRTILHAPLDGAQGDRAAPSPDSDKTLEPRPLGAELCGVVLRLLELPAAGRTRGRILELVATTAPRALAAAWDDWARSRKRHAHEARLVERVLGGHVKGDLQPTAPEPPAALLVPLYGGALLGVARLREPLLDAVARVVTALPGDDAAPGLRARAVIHFHTHVREHLDEGRDPEREAERLRAVATVLGEGGPAAQLLAADDDLRQCGTRPRLHAFYDPLDEAPERGALLDHLRQLPNVVTHDPEGRRWLRLQLYRVLVERHREADWAAACVQLALAPPLLAEGNVLDGRVPLALALGEDSPQQTARILRALLKHVVELAEPAVVRLVDFFRRLEALPLLVREIEHGSVSRVVRWADILAAIDPLDGPDRGLLPNAAPADVARLIDAWPSSLRGAILELARLPDGASRARRILRRAVPDRAAIEHELATLRRKLARSPRPHLAARAASLASRLEAEPRLRPAMVKKLDEKLRRAAEAPRAAQIDGALLAALVASIWPEAPPDPAPEWLQRPEVLDLVAAVSGLTGPERALGYELLRRRAGPPPWLPWDHPANRRFLDKLEARGVRTAPWLATRAATTTLDGKTLHLALEDDPLEILRMGQHFGTCLSPGRMNFFSAVSNAVDVNKRVLYGRAPSGTVMARCLLALTTDGRILTFEPYAHERALRFGERVADFVQRLAADMGTSAAGSGKVPALVARRWYDDGTRDLSRSAAELADTTALRQALRSLPDGEATARLVEVLTEVGVTRGSLSRVLALPELQTRCDIGVGLARRITSRPDMGFVERLELAEWLASVRRLDTGEQTELPLARSVIAVPGFFAWLTTPCPDCGPRSGCHDLLDRTMTFLAQVDPFLLIRALRKTRKRGVRGLRGEPAERRRAAAEALQRLGRTDEAERLRT